MWFKFGIKFETDNFFNSLSHGPPKLLDGVNRNCRFELIIESGHHVIKEIQVIDQYIDIRNTSDLDFIRHISVGDFEFEILLGRELLF